MILRALTALQDRYLRFRDRRHPARCPHCNRRLAR